MRPLMAMMKGIMSLQPLRFRPVFKQYLWGGRRLGTLLGKPIGDGDNYAESWELVDHGADQSVVADGSLAGTTLHDLVAQQGAAVLGRHAPLSQFPLLLKFLDAHQTLSVQVHPNDAQAAGLRPPDLGKTEAWIVLATEPGGKIYAGLRPGVNRTTLEQAVAAGKCDECLHQFEPNVGDCVFLRAGTVHALGAGLVIAELQQASDTTFRLFDWNRVDRDGKPRTLHVQQALETVDFNLGPVNPVAPQPTDEPHVQRLVTCDKFLLDRWHLEAPQPIGGDDRFHIVSVLAGTVRVKNQPLRRGESLLVPASCRDATIEPQGRAVLLVAYLP